MIDGLLAKQNAGSTDIPVAVTLLGHLQQVHAAAESVLSVSANSMLTAFNISTDELPRLRRIVTLAAAVHDVGKANDHFLGMLCRTADRSSYNFRQGVRHEWLSWWWLHLEGVRDWAVSVLTESDDFQIVLCCIAGHHPAVHRPTPPEHTDGAGSVISFWTGHRNFHEINSWLDAEFSVQWPLPQLKNQKLRCSTVTGNVVAEIQRQSLEIDAFINNLGWLDRERWQSFCACAKASVVAADVAGSALSEQLLGIDDQTSWISTALQVRPDPDDIEQLVRERLAGETERPFQSEVASSHSRVTLVTAGCGSGKTVAAWLWAARQCARQRIYFCYPTTGTATEGFRGYLFDDEAAHSKLGSKLFHSRASVDFDLILEAGDDLDGDNELRIASLQAWSTPVVCCTVDTVLGIMQNQRRGLYAWPALAQAAYVFDEIHAYDDKLFGCLLQFLGKLKGLRVLLMTASLSSARLNAIKDVLEDLDEQLLVIGGPSHLEQLPRYHQLPADDIENRIRSEVHAGGRVLWICNVVDRAMQTANQFADLNPLLYHSRFRYEDRVEQHRAVVQAFDRSSTIGCLAICTQVAEMSLDISATQLISETCPVPSLIQRLGRLNRHAQPPAADAQPPETMPFIVTEPSNDDGDLHVMPYKIQTYGDWPERTRTWLSNIGANDISQQKLADAWEQLGLDDEVPAVGDSTWIEGGPRTQVESLRESPSSVTVVMAGDDARRVAESKSELARVAIPMPVPRHIPNWKDWRSRGGYLVVPGGAINYDKNRGAQWLR